MSDLLLLNLCSVITCYPIHKSCFAVIYFRPVLSAGTPSTTRKNGQDVVVQNYYLLWLKRTSLLVYLFNVLTLFYLDWLFICIVFPSDTVINWIEVINGIKIYGNEASLKRKREKFFVAIKCLRRENQTDALFLHTCHILLMVRVVL